MYQPYEKTQVLEREQNFPLLTRNAIQLDMKTKFKYIEGGAFINIVRNCEKRKILNLI